MTGAGITAEFQWRHGRNVSDAVGQRTSSYACARCSVSRSLNREGNMVGAKGFEPSTSWSRTTDNKSHIRFNWRRLRDQDHYSPSLTCTPAVPIHPDEHTCGIERTRNCSESGKRCLVRRWPGDSFGFRTAPERFPFGANASWWKL
jgi:hypothetical protein